MTDFNVDATTRVKEAIIEERRTELFAGIILSGPQNMMWLSTVMYGMRLFAID